MSGLSLSFTPRDIKKRKKRHIVTPSGGVLPVWVSIPEWWHVCGINGEKGDLRYIGHVVCHGAHMSATSCTAHLGINHRVSHMLGYVSCVMHCTLACVAHFVLALLHTAPCCDCQHHMKRRKKRKMKERKKREKEKGKSDI